MNGTPQKRGNGAALHVLLHNCDYAADPDAARQKHPVHAAYLQLDERPQWARDGRSIQNSYAMSVA
jgi:uncharacterized protein YfaQ (DUF2300 family)